jgi:DNA polymerase (family 10)
MVVPMNNTSIAKVFEDLAVLLQAKGENIFKVRAHSKAADAIKSLPYQLADIVDDEDRLRSIPGFGDAIVDKTREMVRTGKLELLARLKTELPDGVLELTQIPGIGAKTAVTAASELGISNFEQLAASIESGEFQNLPRISKKGALQILRHAEYRAAQGGKVGIGRANQMAQAVVEEMTTRCPEIETIEIAGDIRRGIELIGDAILVASHSQPATITDAFTTLSNVRDVLEHDDKNAAFLDDSGFRFELLAVTPDRAGGALVFATGPRHHIKKLNERNAEIDLDALSETNFRTEADVYDSCGLPFIRPEIREGGREFSEPVPSLISLADIKGDLHSHTDWSDGRFPMEEMVAKATDLGREYLAITDHSPSATVANGLSSERLIEHKHAVRSLNDKVEIELLTGTEMDIKPDGSLDYSDEELAELDIVIASIHSGMDQDQQTMTDRVIAAMESPHVDVICHLTAQLLERRAPVLMDVEKIFEKAAATGTVLEINASPERLDLNAEHARMAAEMGVIFAVSTDSHRLWQFENMRYGVQTAARAWIEPWQVINTMPFKEFSAFLRLPKSERYESNRQRGQ